MTSFSASTKDEIARIESGKRCCQLSELAALIKMDGTLEYGGPHKMTLRVVTENAAAARKIFSLIKKLFNVHTQILVRKKNRLKKNNVYYVRINDSRNLMNILQATGLFDAERNVYIEGIDKELVRKLCCRKAYLRGAFLGGGSVSNPSADYHLEIITTRRRFAEDLAELISTFGLKAKIGSRKNWYVVYLKESEQISDFLRVIGASKALLNFENVRVLKDMRNQVNRLVNCETANVNKTVAASARQRENIKYIEKCGGMESLTPALREMAELRLQYPELSLKELGTLADPPVGRSGVSHRLQKLDEIAEEYRAINNE